MNLILLARGCKEKTIFDEYLLARQRYRLTDFG